MRDAHRATLLPEILGLLLLACAASGCSPGKGLAKPGPSAGGPGGGAGPRAARSLDLGRIDGLASAGASAYLSGTASFRPPRQIDGLTIAGAGGSDVFVSRRELATGAPAWARAYGDQLDQFGKDSSAPTADGTVAVIGRAEAASRLGACKDDGTAVACTGVVAGPNPAPFETDFLLLLDAATGAVKPGTRFISNGLSGVLHAVAVHPSRDLIAVCGQAGTGSSELVPGAAFQGGNADLLVALFDTAGGLRWARQVGGAAGMASDETCHALAVAADGTVWAAGRYMDELDLGTGPLPSLGNSTAVRHLWVAHFDATGKTLAAQAFGTPANRCVAGPARACTTASAATDCAGLTPATCSPAPAGQVTPYDLAIDSTGSLLLAGSFTASFPVGGLVSAGGPDAFVAKLAPSLTGTWGVRLGNAGTDLARAVALTRDDEVVAVGTYTPGVTGSPSSGAAALQGPAATAGQVFLLKLDGATGATRFAGGYGDASAQSGTGVAASGSWVQLAGTYHGALDFGAPTEPLRNEGVPIQSFLVVADLE